MHFNNLKKKCLKTEKINGILSIVIFFILVKYDLQVYTYYAQTNLFEARKSYFLVKLSKDMVIDEHLCFCEIRKNMYI